MGNMMLKNAGTNQLKPLNKELHLVAKSDTKLTLLLVHDIAYKYKQWQDIFSHDFNIKTASNGLEALKIILDENIDLILAPPQLSSLSGIDVCKFIKQHASTSHIQMIFVSEHYSELEEEQVLSLGALDYLTADTRPKILFNRVKNHMKLVKHSKQLEHVSKTDTLTGIANRMWFENQLHNDWQAAIRSGGEVSLIMIDIDHFKCYNDEFGHVKGDECLAAVAQCIKNIHHRANDLVARYGGEEFVVLLPFTDLEGAKKIAVDLVAAVQNLNIPHANNARHNLVTISAGIATCSPKFSQESDVDIKSFIEKADLKLYQAKEHGRNQFCY